jgi:hypothetical protein
MEDSLKDPVQQHYHTSKEIEIGTENQINQLKQHSPHIEILQI